MIVDVPQSLIDMANNTSEKHSAEVDIVLDMLGLITEVDEIQVGEGQAVCPRCQLKHAVKAYKLLPDRYFNHIALCENTGEVIFVAGEIENVAEAIECDIANIAEYAAVTPMEALSSFDNLLNIYNSLSKEEQAVYTGRVNSCFLAVMGLITKK